MVAKSVGVMTGMERKAAAFPEAMVRGPVRLASNSAWASAVKVALVKKRLGSGKKGKLFTGGRFREKGVPYAVEWQRGRNFVEGRLTEEGGSNLEGVVLQVRPYAREVDDLGDTGRLKESLGADATGLEDLGGVDGASSEDHFLLGRDG